MSITLSFDYDGAGLGKGGTTTLGVDGTTVATGRIEHTVPFLFSMSGETLDGGVGVRVDPGFPVGAFLPRNPPEFRFTGKVASTSPCGPGMATTATPLPPVSCAAR
jgi:hypothetical protein